MGTIGKDGISYINRMVSTSLAPLIIFFIAAGAVSILRGWIYFGSFLAVNLINLLFIGLLDTDLLNARGTTKSDIKKTDHILISLYLAVTHVIAPLVAGIEIRAAGSGYLSTLGISAGIIAMLLSCGLENWAMYHNAFFERNIRIQTDRNHSVVTTGPYRIIRHPGYLSYILRYAAFPLILGTFISSTVMMIGVVLLLVRTGYEDGVLARELAGYPEYRKAVKYRILPFVW